MEHTAAHLFFIFSVKCAKNLNKTTLIIKFKSEMKTNTIVNMIQAKNRKTVVTSEKIQFSLV